MHLREHAQRLAGTSEPDNQLGFVRILLMAGISM